MGLKDLQLPRDTVEIPGGASFSVRGLSYVDLTQLLGKHGAVLSEFFQVIAGGDTQAMAEDFGLLAGRVVMEAPALAADVIALASDEPDAFEVVLRLPFPTQTEALSKIGKLTFATEEDVKKFLQTAKAALGMFQAKS